MSRTLISLFILFSFSAYGEWDFKVEQLLRSFPTGFYVKSNIGYSKKIWKGEEDYLYGYIRPALNLQTSAVVNVANAHIDFNPISFVNLYAGSSYTNRNISKISNFDCEQVSCRGRLKRTYYGARVALALKKFVLVTGVKKINVHFEKASSLSFADELSSTIASPSNDLLTQKLFMLGYKVKENLMLAYLGQFNHMKNTDQKTKMHIILGKYSINKDWEVSAGPGVFETRTGSKVLTLLSLLTWKYKDAPILAN